MKSQQYKFGTRSLLDKVLEYKYFVAFVSIFFIAVTLFYIAIADKLYRSDTIIEIAPKESRLDSTKVNPLQSSDYERYFQTQMDFLKSRHLVSKVVNKIHSNIKYFSKNSLGIYKYFQGELPIRIEKFNIKDKSFYKRYFQIKVLDDNRYQLSLVKDGLLNNSLSEPIVCNFGEEISSRFIDFKISKEIFYSDDKIFLKVLPKYEEIGNATKRLNVTRSSDKSSFIKISYDDNMALRTKVFLDALIEIYKDITINSKKNEVDNFSTAIDEEIAKVKRKLDENERKLLEFSSKNQTSGISKQTDNLVDKLDNDKQKLQELQMQYQTLRTVLVMVKDENNYESILSLLSDIDNKSIAILINAILDEEKIYQKERQKYKDLHPKMVELKRSISVRKTALKKNLVELYRNIKQRIDKLERDIQDQENSLTQVPSKEMGLAKLKSEHERLEKDYFLLLDKRTKLKLIDQNYILKIVDLPYLPNYHIKPKGKILLLFSMIFGTLVGVFLVLVRDYFRKKIVVPADIEENSFIPLIGTITHVKDRDFYNTLFVLEKPDITASKMIWELSNSIQRYRSKDRGMVISVTSMIRGEGKTTICANLAMALSQGDKSVIVVSLDLRLPNIHRKFDVSNRAGITSVMYDGVDINSVITRVPTQDNLFVLPSGALPQSPMKVINSNFMDKLFIELRKVFDYIVVDLAPLSVAPESILMLRRSDLNLMILKSNYSDKKFLEIIEDTVKKNGIKNIAYVLNGLNQKYVKTISRVENKRYLKDKEILNLNF